MIDYHLVIVGGSPAGMAAAVMAARRGARVALIVPPETYPGGYQFHDYLMVPHPWCLSSGWDDLGMGEEGFSFARLRQWVLCAVETGAVVDSLGGLAQLGVDVIREEGELQWYGGKVAIALSSRRLLASRYLLAPTTESRVEIEGLFHTGYLTLRTLHRLEVLPSTLAIVGDDPRGVVLAQLFQELGSQVTLIIRKSRIFVGEEPEAVELIEGQLKAAGIQVLTGTEVTGARTIEGQIWLQVGNQGIAVDQVLLVTQPRVPVGVRGLEVLNLEWGDRGLITNDKLQTNHPQIYACGEILRPDAFPHIANYEAQIAVKNALTLPFFKVNYGFLPYTIYGRPPLGRVGLTEAEAKERYGDSVQVIQQVLRLNPAAIMSGEITGWIKAIAHPNGRLLGATFIGTKAAEIIPTLSLAIRHQIKLQDLYHTPAPFGSIAQSLTSLSLDWNTQQFDRHSWLKPLFNWWLSLHRD